MSLCRNSNSQGRPQFEELTGVFEAMEDSRAFVVLSSKPGEEVDLQFLGDEQLVVGPSQVDLVDSGHLLKEEVVDKVSDSFIWPKGLERCFEPVTLD